MRGGGGGGGSKFNVTGQSRSNLLQLLMIRRMVEYGDESSCAVVKSKRE